MLEYKTKTPTGFTKKAAALTVLSAFSSVFCQSSFAAPEAVNTHLAAAGRATMPIQIAARASERSKALANTLASYLKRISGADFEVKIATGNLSPTTTGLVLGVAQDFGLTTVADPTRREDYSIDSRANGVTILAQSEDGLQDAVWDFLYRLGYRHFFSDPKWEIIPRSPTLNVKLRVKEHPVYLSRRIWYGYGPLPENREQYDAWCAHNRLAEGARLATGHAYGQIIRRNQAEFERHPEYFALVKGERRSKGNVKFCISNPGLRQLVVEDSLRQMAADPTLGSISLEPSDGSDWCECPECAKMGSVTDRVVTLANQVAEALAPKYPNTFVGIYAYNEHSPPPTIKVHRRVVPSLATSFIRGGFTVDQLLDGWGKKASMLGIREYYSVNPWDRDMPGQARGGNPDYLKTTISHFADKGARFLSAESSANFGPNGLGYYLASRYMWNPAEAANESKLKEDFLEKSFGLAKEPMRRWYGLIDSGTKPLVSQDLIGRMFRELKSASGLTQDEGIRGRLNDLILYTRYADLFQRYSNATGAARQSAFEDMMKFAYRIRKTEMIHVMGLWRDLPNREKTVKLPAGAAWNIPEPKNPWKSSAPFLETEIAGFVAEGIEKNPLLEFTPKSFSDDLVPANRLKLSSVRMGELDLTRGVNHYYTWAETVPVLAAIKGTAGLVYKNRGPAKIAVFPKGQTEGLATFQTTVADDSVEHDLGLQFTLPGLQRLEIQDATAGTKLTWADGTPMVLESSLERPARISSRWNLYFYVPKGTKVVGGFSNGGGNLLDSTGETVKIFDRTGYWSVPVNPGQDGKLWKFANCNGQRMLMTVPPYLARNASELLVPREVLDADMVR